MNNDEKGPSIVAQFQRMKGNRGNWESHWQEISDRIIPSHSDIFQGTSGFNQGSKRNGLIYDATAANALGRFGAILDSLLTPRNQTWHRMTTNNKDLNRDRNTKLWFEETNRILFKYRYAPKANFAAQNQQVYKSLGAFGTSGMFIDQLSGEPGIRYRNVHLGELFIAENHQGIVDHIIRRFPLTSRQAVQKWGEVLPDTIQESAKTNPEREFWFLHEIKPNENRDPDREDFRGMAFLSSYVSETEKVLISEGGYRTMPLPVTRYEQVSGEMYGRSPAMEVLPAIKTLNEQKKTMLKQGHRAVDPVLLAHDDGILDTFSMRPGAINAGGVSAEGRALVQALPTGNYQVGKDMMDDERNDIKDAFLVTLFQILTENPGMTATEVMERSKEKGLLLAPTVGRQADEYLGPLVERELDVLMMQGLIPPMPDALREAEGEYTLTYDSPLARAQKAEEASGLMRSIEMALQVVNVTQNPEPLDHFDWDAIMPEVGEIQGVPLRWMRDPKVIQQMREGRAQQAQQQQDVQSAPAAAAMMKVVGGK